MKQAVEKAGLRVPRHGRARSTQEAWAAVERCGFPAIVKPIDGAGSKDTYRCNDKQEFEAALQKVKHIDELSVEEFIEGEELTYDTVCADGRILFENVAWYKPKPMILAQNPWISMQNIVLRDLDAGAAAARRRARPRRAEGARLPDRLHAHGVVPHPKGEAVFGEIGGRPPGARLVHAMNYSCDIDLFRGWAEAACFRPLEPGHEQEVQHGDDLQARPGRRARARAPRAARTDAALRPARGDDRADADRPAEARLAEGRRRRRLDRRAAPGLREHAEVYEQGLGLVPGVVPLPHARRRLQLDDRARVGQFAARFAPARGVALDDRTRVDWDGRQLVIHPGTRVLREDGSVQDDAA
jgi:hypothetical protein